MFIRRLCAAWLVISSLGGVAQAQAPLAYDPVVECSADPRFTVDEALDNLRTGWRPLASSRPGHRGPVNELANARVIHDVFVNAGLSDAIAFAAIVNAWAESALDEAAVMDDPYVYLGKPYPNGSGAIGLFQLLPSSNGAGGPSGPEQGYAELFQGGRYAGNRRQARLYRDTPDARGRTYYDATNPRINAERIVLEVRRDGKRLIAADAQGASIAVLSQIFGAEIERPQTSTFYRRKLAAQIVGAELAWANHPSERFAPPLDPLDEHEAYEAHECASAPPVLLVASNDLPPEPAPEPNQSPGLPVGAAALMLAGLSRYARFGA